MDLILGGWNVNYFLSTHTGFPVTINAPAHQNNTGQSVRGNVRANYYRPLPEPAEQNSRSLVWFRVDTYFCQQNGVDNGICSYGLPALGQFGSAGVGTERCRASSTSTPRSARSSTSPSAIISTSASSSSISLNYTSWGPPGSRYDLSRRIRPDHQQIGNPRNIQFGLKYYF